MFSKLNLTYKTRVILKRKKVKLYLKDHFKWCFNGLLFELKYRYQYPDKVIQINTVPNLRPCQKCHKTSVEDPDNPHAFEPTGSGSISQRYGSDLEGVERTEIMLEK